MQLLRVFSSLVYGSPSDLTPVVLISYYQSMQLCVENILF